MLLAICTLKRFLLWDCIKFLAFPSKMGGIHIIVLITWKWLKGHGTDVNVFRVASVGLLPPHLVFSNSARLLTMLGLMKDIFQDFSSGTESMTYVPKALGSICIKQEFMNFLVFNQDFSTRIMEDKSKPWSYSSMLNLMSPLLHLAGFAMKLSLHSL